MGILFNNQDEIKKAVEDEFQETNNYLIAIKHDNLAKNTLKLLLSSLLYTMDSNRTFVVNY